MSILETIKAYKPGEVAEQRRRVPTRDLEDRMAQVSSPRRLVASLAAARLGLIAEIKKASPTRGLIRPHYDPAACALAYEEGGATALSVLTDSRSFQGSLDDLAAARAASTLPVLRKDFIFETYQVLESRAWSADAILLIMAVLDRSEAAELFTYAQEIGLDAIVEVHTEKHLQLALDFGARAIGVNNRDLHTFDVDLTTTTRLAAQCPDDVLIISESGISGRGDIVELTDQGIRSFLVGESLMRQADLAAAVRELLPTDTQRSTHEVQP